MDKASRPAGVPNNAEGASAPEKSTQPKEFDGQQADDLLDAKRLRQQNRTAAGPSKFAAEFEKSKQK